MKYLSFIALLIAFPVLALAQSPDFISLTKAPFLESAGNAATLPDFLNQIYRICIGAAAVIAVLQIMRAGIMYMGGDSVTEKKQAKQLIGLSIGGLILVLSPVVVFSIINPDILDLKIDRLDELGTGLSPQAQDNTLWVRPGISAESGQQCTAQGGTPYYTCTPKTGGTGRTVSVSQGCDAATENASTVCRRDADTPDPGSCTNYGTPTASIGQTCTADGFTQIDRSCCSGIAEGAVCCGKRQTTNEMFAWKGIYYVDNACAIDPARASSCQTQVLRGGAYATQQQCQREFESGTRNKLLLGSIKCSCDFNLGSQLGAYCLNDTP